MFSKSLNYTKFVFYILFANITLYHFALFKYIINHINIYSFGGISILFSIIVLLLLVNSIIFITASFILPIRAFKIFTILNFICNSIAMYFVFSFNTMFTRSMMGNVFNTNYHEAISLFDIKILFYIFIFGVIPSFFVFKTKIVNVKKINLIKYLILTVLICGFIMYLSAKTWLFIDRNARIIGALAMPISYIANTYRYFSHKMHDRQTFKQLDTPSLNNKKMAVVFVIGESARANNFSLYGYSKNTNPKLSKQNIKTLKAHSLHTYTTASIGEMLFVDKNYEPLPTYLHRLGVNVIYKSNNWGEPNINIDKYIDFKKIKCENKCIYDENLTQNLTQQIISSKKNKTLIVIHTEGSHGPLYTEKYTKDFEVFKPVCNSVDLSSCSHKTLMNAYDNSIVYTDYVLDKIITKLKKIHNIPIVMLYMSDHGESLGEDGFYLHGTPYSIAPNFQKEIPFIVWSNNMFKKKFKYKNLKHHNQHNIFHSILGVFEINSKYYNEGLDIFRH